MPKGYNALSDIEINHAEIGICPEHGYLLTSDQCNCHPEMKALFYVAEQLNFRDKHTFQIDKDLKQLDAHPVEEAYQAEKQNRCEMCYCGYTDECPCCNGNWQDCQNCRPEGTGNDTADLLAGMR